MTTPFPPYTSGACVVPCDDAPLLRPRGDRRGFEPLDPGPLPAPDHDDPPPYTWMVPEGSVLRSQACPHWRGESTARLVMDLGAGLGDIARFLPHMRAIQRSGRVGELLLRSSWARSPQAFHWLQTLVQPLQLLPEQAPIAPTAGLESILWVPRFLWRTPFWRRRPAPMTALVAHALDLPLQDLAGPCAHLPTAELEAMRARLVHAGWQGEPLVALQADPMPALTSAHADFRRAKLAGGLARLAAPLGQQGCFVVLVGGGTSGQTAVPLDLCGQDLLPLTALLFLADLAVVADSGPLHLAGMLGTPVLALFGPTDPGIHVCAAGTLACVPTSSPCPRLPCGRGSLTGRLEYGGMALQLPCPGAYCLEIVAPAALAEVVAQVLAELGL